MERNQDPYSPLPYHPLPDLVPNHNPISCPNLPGFPLQPRPAQMVDLRPLVRKAPVFCHASFLLFLQSRGSGGKECEPFWTSHPRGRHPVSELGTACRRSAWLAPARRPPAPDPRRGPDRRPAARHVPARPHRGVPRRPGAGAAGAVPRHPPGRALLPAVVRPAGRRRPPLEGRPGLSGDPRPSSRRTSILGVRLPPPGLPAQP